MEIRVHGNELIQHVVEGQVVLEYSRPQLDPVDKDARNQLAGWDKMLGSGTISLQSESHPVEFRRVELMKLGE